MKLGVLSDSHDNLPALERIVARFNEERVDLVLHAGDFVSPFTSIPLGKLRAPFVGVFGNNDGDRLHLAQRFRDIGTIHPGVYAFETGGVRIALMHEPQAIDALVASNRAAGDCAWCGVDLVVYGHTHKVDLRQGHPAVINPGEAGGWLSGRSTAALFDAGTWTCETFTV